MSEGLKLALDLSDRNTFRPGERLSGRAAWILQKAPRSAEVRLFWFTAGIGTRDIGVVATHVFESPRAEDAQSFALTLPAGPYSFSGRLVSVQWAIELVLKPGDHAQRLEFELSPFDQPLVLEKVEEKRGGFQVNFNR